MIQGWQKAFGVCSTVEVEGKGDGWVLKSQLLEQYGSQQGRSKPAVYQRFKQVQAQFKTTRVGKAVYIKFKEDSQ